MIRMQAAVRKAQDAANSLYRRSPWDYRDMGLNIFTDVARTNARGAGGPAGKTGVLAYSAARVPFGPLTNPAEKLAAAVGSECDAPPVGVELVPLATSVSGVRRVKLTTDQGIDVPDVPDVPAARGMGQALPVGGSYPVSCSPAVESSALGSSGIPSWVWLLVGLGVLVAASNGGRGR